MQKEKKKRTAYETCFNNLKCILILNWDGSWGWGYFKDLSHEKALFPSSLPVTLPNIPLLPSPILPSHIPSPQKSQVT